jgi:hypothetical protein
MQHTYGQAGRHAGRQAGRQAGRRAGCRQAALAEKPYMYDSSSEVAKRGVIRHLKCIFFIR